MSLVASTGPFVQPTRLSDWLKHEYSVEQCREDVALAAGVGTDRVVVSGHVLGLIATGAQTVTVAAKAGNTAGIGVIATATADAKVPAGRWEILIIEPEANAGRFQVRNPKGKLDGAGAVGTAYNGGINFTWADGATDVAAGDAFFVDVDYAAGEAYVELSPTAADGSEVAAGIAINGATAPVGEAARLVVLNGGPARVDAVRLTWPDGITAAQKPNAIRELRGLGIRTTP